ncbi:MAG TPA: nitrous oxide reductase family maturation protein NosD [Planctomycetota bacterium]|nr:nitrous oxide reductase family maturation protein NosD [Planctomycetota bacterium]
MWLELLFIAQAGPLQEIVDRARPGDVVRLAPGVYRERIEITRPITLEGAGRVVIDGAGQGSVVRVTSAPGVTLRGLTVRGSGDSLTAMDAGIVFENSPGSVVEDCRIEDSLFGLQVMNSPNGRFKRLAIRGKDIDMPRRGDGVRVWYSDGVALEQIDMADSRDFIIWFSRNTSVRSCRVSRSRYGLHYMYTDDNRFEGNVLTDNRVAGAIMYSHRLRLAGNRFERSRGVHAYGLLLKDADDVMIEGNEFVDNTTGLFFDNSPSSEDASVTVRRNLFAFCDEGVGLMPSTRRVRFESNTFLDNLSHVTLQGATESPKNDWEGNYWSDHVAYDLDGDGVGDVAYEPRSLYENLTGRHPELALLRFSPSVTAIELAGEMFPVSRGDLKLRDPRPAMRPPFLPKADGAAGVGVSILAIAAALLTLPIAGLIWARRALQ